MFASTNQNHLRSKCCYWDRDGQILIWKGGCRGHENSTKNTTHQHLSVQIRHVISPNSRSFWLDCSNVCYCVGWTLGNSLVYWNLRVVHLSNPHVTCLRTGLGFLSALLLIVYASLMILFADYNCTVAKINFFPPYNACFLSNTKFKQHLFRLCIRSIDIMWAVAWIHQRP